ncbi:MAG TPA: hypothetical protein VKC90_02210 [Chitinophagaceae bacterium]|nr:hypothetical protein [Chitinophagaceae bacterium]
MVNKAFLLFEISICFCLNLSAQNTYSLRWKLHPTEKLKYKAVMSFVDIANFNSVAEDTVGITNLFKSPSKDSLTLEKQFDALLKINQSSREDHLNVLLFEEPKHVVNIEMSIKEETTLSNLLNITTQNSDAKEKVVIRGAVYDNGPIQSFFLRYDLRNVIALLFQLPDKPVKVGDSWPLDIHLISFDQNLKCDTSRKFNKVTLLKIEKQNNETVAVLKYDIDEYISGLFLSFLIREVKTVTNIHYDATAKFSIDKGRWISYKGTSTTHSTGAMAANNIKTYSLIPE